jgi:hypothetical protein
MDMINEETGERAPGHRIGTDETGEDLYQVPDGWTPEEPYWLDADGYAHEGAAPEPGISPAEEAAYAADCRYDQERDDRLTGDC